MITISVPSPFYGYSVTVKGSSARMKICSTKALDTMVDMLYSQQIDDAKETVCDKLVRA